MFYKKDIPVELISYDFAKHNLYLLLSSNLGNDDDARIGLRKLAMGLSGASLRSSKEQNAILDKGKAEIWQSLFFWTIKNKQKWRKNVYYDYKHKIFVCSNRTAAMFL